MYGAREGILRSGQGAGGQFFCRRGGKMLDFVSRFCLNSITMDKWAPAVAGAFFVYCRYLAGIGALGRFFICIYRAFVWKRRFFCVNFRPEPRGVRLFFYGGNFMYDLNEWCGRLIEHEGMKLMPYRCTAGKLTIGVGRNLEDNPPTPEEARALGDYMHGITENAAKMLLRNDIARCFEALKRIVEGFEELDSERQYALLDMCFQMGVRGFRRFKRLLKAVEQRNFELAAFECLTSKYARQTPKRAKRIAQLLKTGVWK